MKHSKRIFVASLVAYLSMALQRFLRLRRLQRFGKVLVIALSVCSISYFLFTFSKLRNAAQHVKGLKGGNTFINVGNNGTRSTLAIYPSTDTDQQGYLNVHIWRMLCGESVDFLRKSLFFPQYPDEEKFISEFRVEDNAVDYGQRIFGYIHAPRSDSFRFGIASDDSSELWISTSEHPKDKKLIARVYEAGATAWTAKDDIRKYPDQISKTALKFERGEKYYIEVLHKQIGGDGFVQVFWTTSSDENFKLITSEYLSPYEQKISALAKKDANHNVLAKRYRDALQIKSANGTKNDSFNFYSLPFIPVEDYLPSCKYRSGTISHQKVYRYEGVRLIFDSNVYPGDDTAMAVDDGNVWQRANREADKEIIEAVVDKLMASLESHTLKRYYLKRIHKVLQKPDPVYGDRYLVDLELGIMNRKESYRLSEHVYQKKGSASLCFPEGVKWNKTATVYFILPVKDQGRWVYHFINELTVASLLTGDTNFHVIIVDFESQDINLTRAFDTDLLRERHTVINITGKFYKTLALNTAVQHVPSQQDLLFLFDLHIDVPVDIIDAVRKNTVEGRIAFFPAVGRLDCGRTFVDHRGFWEMDGFGLVSVYKSDWIRFGGMNTEDYKYKWGGEDWDLLDRVVNAQLEVERYKYPGLYHHYHTKQKDWS